MYIFFDVDGVFNSSSTLGIGRLYDDYIETFAKLVKKYNAKPVMISTWRFGIVRNLFGRLKPLNSQNKMLLSKFKKNKIKIYDLLPEGLNEDRAHQILEYVNKHKIKNFIIIDDEAFEYKQLGLENKVVKTYFSNHWDRKEEGFSEKAFNEADILIKTMLSNK